MKLPRPQLLRETLVDLMPVDQDGKIWLQQGKEFNSDWRLIDRRSAATDLIGYAYKELTQMGFLVHELLILRDGATFWTFQSKLKRARHVVILAEVNYSQPPIESEGHYLAAFPYAEAITIKQRFFSDLRLLSDPAVAAAVMRMQHLKP